MEKLLKETEGYLQKLGVKLQEQKDLARLESDFVERDSKLEDTAGAGVKDQTQVV